MGSEAKCQVKIGEKSYAGTALLETDEILFRSAPGAGSFRLRIPLRGIESIRAEGGTLIIVSKGGEARLALGALAEKWKTKVLNPPSLLDKLGITAETDVAVTGDFEAAFAEELASRAKSVRRGAPTAKTSVVLLRAATVDDLARLVALRSKLRDDAAAWVVYAKSKTHLKESDVLAAGRAAGFKDVKVARFSDTHTALKFVLPREARKKP